LNPDFNVVWVQAIMETIKRMAPDGSPLVVLAQQGAEAANLVVVEKSVGIRGNLPSRTTIGQGVPEVKLRHRQVQIIVCLSMMHDGVSLRTVSRGNMATNVMTSATLLKIGGVSGLEYHPHHDDF
jgi:hypothetical protein